MWCVWDQTKFDKMKQILTLVLVLWAGLTMAQTGYEVHTCQSGHCASITFPESNADQLKSLSSGDWCEPIRVSVGIQQGVIITTAEIEAEIAEDSQIAIDEGLFTGEGEAYILANIFTFSPDDITDEGLPFVMNSVNATFSTINFNGNVGTIYDNHVLDNRSCYGSHKTIAIVANNTPGVQETASNGLNPDEDFNPTEVIKLDAFTVTGIRNHAITHSGGQNHPDHENGPDFEKRPLNVGNLFSFGWSSVGNAGFSGGNTLGTGPNGEDLAGHIANGHATWVGLIPNLTASILSVPAEIDIDENGTFEADINKDIGNENWSWTFTKGATTLSENSNPVSISFSEAGTWTYEVIVTNDCQGQSDTLTGTFVVNSSMVAPTAICNDITISLDGNGMATVFPSMIDNGSFDDGTIVSMKVNGSDSLNFNCQNDVANVTLTVTDNHGLNSSCMATVNLTDDMPPEVSVANTTIYLDENGDATITLGTVIDEISDNCGIVSEAISKTIFDCSELGNNSVTVTVTDDSGNETTESAMVTVVDEIFPTLECVGDFTIQLAAGQDTTLDVNDLIVDVSDNCGVSAITASQYEFSGDTLGTYSVTVTAVDNAGNETLCSVPVTVTTTTSTSNVEDDTRISIYPNPTRGWVNIEIDGTLHVTQVVLFDCRGREILRSPFAPQISVEHVPQGIFLVVLITTDGNRYIQRILKLW